ncbi:cbb3-type cytochrome c oxidase subunit I [Microaerobacter geothermalis]|uniref:cbb3-type cytochrome c oxidase subunit I n=1 Tax=Microaerobacter geothermalis TaxID=674972 RepID=UPI001F30B69F|nr:cbb3-type cytochrome c oxidase subunit I [Microaerobacter geothermalis]MCF6093019.1 cbb3-type cytochrome c oxidase subunit I [Microaerobacter geothermalis]
MNKADILKFSNADNVAKKFLLTSAFYLILVTLFGIIMSINLVKPEWIPDLFNFVAMRALHLQTIIFGWLSMALMGAIYYIVPRIVDRDLFSKPLGNLHYWLMHVGIALVAVTILAGKIDGREYLEPVWWVDVAIAVVWVIFAANVFMTVFKGNIPHFSPALNFILLSVLYLGLNFVWANFIPWKGVYDNLAIWTFAHNEVNGWFMFGLQGIFYFMIPKMTGTENEKPPYPEVLSKVHFWAVAIFIPPSVLHHLLYQDAPVNTFWKLMGEWTSVGMLIPTFIWFYIITVSIRNSKKPLGVPGKFVVATMVFYVMNCIQGSSQSIRFINDFVHGSQWVVGHAHLALLGFISFGVFAFTYWMVQTYWGECYDEKLANVHYWLVMIGFLGMFIPLTIAGLVEGAMAGENFYTIREAIRPYLIVRGVSGAIVTLAAIVFSMNMWKVIKVAKTREIGSHVTRSA